MNKTSSSAFRDHSVVRKARASGDSTDSMRANRDDLALVRQDTSTWLRLAAAESRVVANESPSRSLAQTDVLTIDVRLQAISNDTDYLNGRTWGMYGDQTTPMNLYGSQAGEAWAAGHIGSMKVAIGVIDSGVDYTHIDLFSNIWLNQSEIPFAMRGQLTDTDGDALITFRDLNGAANRNFVTDANFNGRIDGGDLLMDARWSNGIDEAADGYVDDLIGWDFVGNDNNPLDDHGHGTHVAGTIGARGGDGTGVAGVAWNTQIVALKFLDANGSGSSTNAIRAIDYFTRSKSTNPGIDFAATNNSWGGGGYTQPLQDAITRAAQADILFVAAAGNSAADNDAGGFYPANYSTLATAGYDAVLSVAAITSTGGLAAFSNYGAQTVDIGAPGEGIYSTARGGGYAYMSGTSMAAPHVAGAIALFSAANPTYTAAQIRAELLGSATATASLAGKTATGGRLDAAEFVAVAPAPAPTPTPTPGAIYGTAGNDTIRGTAANELISGAPQTGANPGRGSVDMLYGGGGNDVFVFGDARGRFYDDGAAGQGWNDYAQVHDFAAGDKIQLAGQASDYHFKPGTWDGPLGLYILHDSNGDRIWDSGDEFLGHVIGLTSYNANDFTFIGGTPTPTPTPTPGAIFGTAGNDTIRGTIANEQIFGVPQTGTNPGRGSVDMLYGGGGDDVFVFGDARGRFYDDGAAGQGWNDYAQVHDFGAGDKIQLSGQASDYHFKLGTWDGPLGLYILHDSNGDRIWDAGDEFLGHIVGLMSFNPDHFVFG